jgi:hypothetical protein
LADPKVKKHENIKDNLTSDDIQAKSGGLKKGSEATVKTRVLSHHPDC